MDRDQGTTVKVDARMEDGTIVLSLLDKEGQDLMQKVLDGGEAASLWSFQGTRYADSYTKDRIIGVNYACGGTRYQRTEGNVSWTDYKDAIKVRFDLQGVTDVDALYALRDIGYFTGGLVVEPGSTPEQMRLRPKTNCKICGGVLRNYVELEWKVCDTCSAVCEHEYEWGVGQARGNLAYLPFCGKCGRGDPDWEPSEDPAEDLVNTVSEGALDMVMVKHPDKSATIITKQ